MGTKFIIVSIICHHSESYPKLNAGGSIVSAKKGNIKNNVTQVKSVHNNKKIDNKLACKRDLHFLFPSVSSDPFIPKISQTHKQYSPVSVERR